MRRFFQILSMLLSVAGLAAPGLAADAVGVLLLHGKTGMPGQMAKLAAALDAAGYITGRPEMCWSKKRIYDKAFDGCLADIDAAIGRLKANGATKVVLGGTSMGAVAAVAYAATHPELAGVIAIVPAADPVDPSPYPAFAASLKQAKALAKAGKGDDPAAFTDIVSGGVDVTVNVSPNLFMSFHGADSPASTIKNGLAVLSLPKIKIPTLWVAATKDPSQDIALQMFLKIPKNKLSELDKVDSDHSGAPDASPEVVLAWLKKVVGP